MKHFLLRCVPALLLLLPEAAAAQIEEGIAAAGSSFMGLGCGGGSCFMPVVVLLIIGMRAVLAIWATYNIVRVGFSLLVSRDEGDFDKAKYTIAAIAAGLMLSVMPIENLVIGFMNIGVDPGIAAIGPADEIYGIIRWSLVMVAVVSVVMIIVTGVRAVIKFGSDEGVPLMRKTVFAVVEGILVIIFAQAIKAALGVPDFGDLGAARPGPFAIAIITVVQALLVFVALVAVVMIIYAGITMVAYFGNEEKFTAAKNLIFRVIIGLVVIAVSYLLVRFVVSAVVCGSEAC